MHLTVRVTGATGIPPIAAAQRNRVAMEDVPGGSPDVWFRASEGSAPGG